MITYKEIRDAVLAVKERPQNLAGDTITTAKIAEIRSAVHFKDLLAEIRNEAERAKMEPVPTLSFSKYFLFNSKGTRIEFEIPYFERRGRLLALVMSTVLDETDLYMESLENLLWDICDEYSWALPACLPYTMEGVLASRVKPEQIVDLFAAETSHALAETLYLLGDRLNPLVTHRVRTEIELRIFQPVFDTSIHFNWEAATNNWSAVCGGSVGMAALLLVDDPERLAGMIDRVLSAMESFLIGYGEDGCCPEGVAYWNYGFGYFTYFAEMLYAYTYGELDMLQGEKIRRIAQFPSAASLTAPSIISYSDSSLTFKPHTGLHSRLSQRLEIDPPELTQVPSLHEDHCYRWAHQVRNLFWTNAAIMHQRTAGGTHFFPDTDWLIDKRLTNSGLMAFSAKGGHNGEPHNHNDLGQFIVHIAGETLLSDLGAGVYTRDYFGEARYTYLCTSSAGHSVPLINGQQQQAGRANEAYILRNEFVEETLYYKLDLTKAYGPEAGIDSLWREYAWTCDIESSRGRLVLQDTFAFVNETNQVAEHFMSFHKPVIGEGQVVWRGGKGEVTLTYDSLVYRSELEEIPNQNYDQSVTTIYRVRLHSEHEAEKVESRFVFDCYCF